MLPHTCWHVLLVHKKRLSSADPQGSALFFGSAQNGAAGCEVTDSQVPKKVIQTYLTYLILLALSVPVRLTFKR